jgi:hypothetical protein
LVGIEDVTGSEGVGPRWLQYVYAMIVDAGADIAVVYCGSIRNDLERGVRQTLWVLDLEVVYFKPGLWAELVGRLKALAQPSRAVGVFAPEHLALQFSDPSVRVEALPPEFDPELMVTFAAECIGVGILGEPATSSSNTVALCVNRVTSRRLPVSSAISSTSRSRQTRKPNLRRCPMTRSSGPRGRHQ